MGPSTTVGAPPRRILRIFGSTSLAILGLTSLALLGSASIVAGLAAAATAGKSSGGAVLELHSTKLGAILVNSRGYTIYAFTKDARNSDQCARIADCLTVWPAVTTSGRPIAGRGVRSSLIGTITLKGRKQVTYAGHPLYTYVADTHPAQTTYVNILQFGGRWPALNSAGQEIK